MEDLFKNRFENFEPTPPKDMLNNIINKAKQSNTASPKKILSKRVLYTVTAAAVVALVSFITLSQNNKTENKIDELISTTNNIDKQNTPIKQTNSINKDKNLDNKLFTTNSTSENNSAALKTRETTDDFHIIADRITCTGSVFIKTDIDVNGSWSSNTSGVNFEYSDSSQTTVYFNGEGKIIFTFELADHSKLDTFALIFYKPVNINYTMTAADCGEENGKVIFTSNSDRTFNNFSGSYDITTSGKNVTIDNLPSGALSLTFKDLFFCDYSKLFSVASNRIEGEISYNNTIVNKATLFSTNITNSGVTYQWYFGDNGISTEEKPSHTYQNEGTYTVKLVVKKAICIDTLRKNITITKESNNGSNDDNNNDSNNDSNDQNKPTVNKFIIPNVITPNGDGKNDVFKISYPDNIKEFHAYILNKSGIVIAKWDDPKGTWDGSYKGKIVPTNTYYYVIKGTYTDGTLYEFKSFIEVYK